MEKEMKLPLEGVRVIELGTHLVVPTTTRFLADWGAEVIKIESPRGDEYRIIGKTYSTPIDEDENPLFFITNMNKKMTCINLKTAEGIEILNKLIADADIFATNVRLEPLEKMGISYENMKKINSKIIYLHFTGYGYQGPDANRPGFDIAAFWARSGALADSASIGEFPAKQSMGFGDTSVSSVLLGGVLAALYRKEKTGEGCFLTSSLYSSAIWYNFTGIMTSQEPYNNKFPKSKDAPSNPISHIYRCKDGEWITTALAGYDHNYARTMKAFDMEEYIEDKRFQKLENCNKHMKEFLDIINAKFATRTSDEWSQRFKEYDIVHEKLVHFKDVSKDPQVWANRYMSKVKFPSGNEIAFPNIPVQFREFGCDRQDMPGSIGCDTEAVLKDLNYTQEEIDILKEKKIALGK